MRRGKEEEEEERTEKGEERKEEGHGTCLVSLLLDGLRKEEGRNRQTKKKKNWTQSR